MIDKVRDDLLAAVDVIPSGASVAVGGFGWSGRPDTLLTALADLDKRELHVVINNVGDPDGDSSGSIARLAAEGRLRKVTGSFPLLQRFYDDYYAGKVELELVPQGTLAERMRAGGAGVPAFYTPVAAGTMLADGTFVTRFGRDGEPDEHLAALETRMFGEREHVLELALTTDFALVRAHQGDRKGNLRFRRAARNFNPVAAMCAAHTIAEVGQLVDVDVLDPDDVHLSGVFVADVVLSDPSLDRHPTDKGVISWT